MRSLALLGLVVAVLLVTAVASPWVTWGLVDLLDHPFTLKRVYNRVFELLLAITLIVAWRRLDLGGPTALGLRRAGWTGELGRGLMVGFIGVGAALLLCAAAGSLDPALRYPAAKTVRKALLGAGAAIGIGLGEEALFRGVLLRRLSIDAGRTVAVVATTIIYAAVHAIGHGSKVATFTAWSGVERTRTLFAPLAAGVSPELLGLALLGLLLAVVRLRSGSLWIPIGIHAAWVAVFRIGRLFFHLRPKPAWLVGPGWPPLIGGIAAWVGILVMALLLFRRRKKSLFVVM